MYLHPELARALVADRARDLERARRPIVPTRRRRAARAHGAPSWSGDDVVIRMARPADAARLARLGQLDGGTETGKRLAAAAGSPDGEAPLVAEVAGELVAALETATGRAAADPFRSSAAAQELLRLRARQLSDAPPAPAHRLATLLHTGAAGARARAAR